MPKYDWGSKTLFIIPTDAQNYKIIGMLKTIKIRPSYYSWYAAMTLTTS